MLTSSPGTVVARMCAMPLKTWTANEAQARFAEMTADAQAIPQIVALSDGKKVYVVSQEYFDKAEHAIKLPLLTGGYAGPEDRDFDRALEEVDRKSVG